MPGTVDHQNSLRWIPHLRAWRESKDRRKARFALLRLLPQVSFASTVGLLLLVVTAALMQTAFALATGVLLAAVPPAVVSGFSSGAGGHLKVWLVVVASLFVAQQLMAPFTAAVTDSFARKVDRALRLRVMRAVGRPAGIGHLEDPGLLDKIRDAQGVGTGQVSPGQAVGGIAATLQARLSVVASTIILMRFRWWLALILVGYGWITRWRLVDDMVRNVGVSVRFTPDLRRSDYVRDIVLAPGAAKETRVFGLSSWLVERFREQWLSAMTSVWSRRKEKGAKSWTWSIPWGGLTLLGLWLVGNAAVRGEIGIAAIAIYAQASFGAGRIWLGNEDLFVAYGAVSVPALLELEKALVPDPPADATYARPDGLPMDGIRLSSVAFRYPGRTEDVYRDLDLFIPAGRSTAIVGDNGAGKTTLVKLLARLYDPTSGSITVDGVDLRSFEPRSWQRRVAAIFQDFVHYALPAHDNVALGAVERIGDRDAVIRAADKVGIATAIEDLPKAWDTTLSREFTDGADLSGGQWQRLALARALFAVEAGAGILVLDEPTANLDVRAEAELFDRFLELTQGITTILISHRFSSVRHADRIVVLNEGRIVEEGSHQELMDLSGRYAHMFELQASRFREAATEGEPEHA